MSTRGGTLQLVKSGAWFSLNKLTLRDRGGCGPWQVVRNVPVLVAGVAASAKEKM